MPSRSVSDRPSRSTDHVATMSNSFAFTAFIMASSPGRSSLPLAPLMPASSWTFQIYHPDLSATAVNSRS
jgi:hypothetical protein